MIKLKNNNNSKTYKKDMTDNTIVYLEVSYNSKIHIVLEDLI